MVILLRATRSAITSEASNKEAASTIVGSREDWDLAISALLRRLRAEQFHLKPAGIARTRGRSA
jgi:hypothetical protein